MRTLHPILVLICLGSSLAACQKSAGTPSASEDHTRLLAALPPAQPFELDQDQAARFLALSLECTRKDFPNKPSHVYHSAGEVLPPREVTPAFYGCFDWHSAVHGHWAMVRLLKRFPSLPQAPAIRARLEDHLSPENLAAELAFFQQPRSATFERPYGWAWLLRLYAELVTFDDPQAKKWAKELKPLSDHLARGTQTYLTKLSAPIRAGTHANTAFALSHMLDMARITDNAPLAKSIEQRARKFYSADKGCPTAYEPSGEDFISPCLAEADLMRRVLPPAEFSSWLEEFLPDPGDERFAPLLSPPLVIDKKDPRIGHLIGLDFQRAWCFSGIAQALPQGHPRRAVLERLSAIHRQAGIDQLFQSGYGGSHWLASFAIYLLTQSGPYR